MALATSPQRGVRPSFPVFAAPETTAQWRWAGLGVALVLLAHLAGAAAWLWWPQTPAVAPALPPIEVTLWRGQATAPQPSRAPAQAPAAPSPTQTPRATPAPERARLSPVLSSTAPAPNTHTAAASESPAPRPVTSPLAAVAPTPAPVAPSAPSAQSAIPSPVSAEGPRPSSAPKVLSGSAVRYLTEPVLTYPRTSRDLGESGTVVLKVLVDEQGRPKEVEVARSSGHVRLDQQALQAMRRARFQPHVEDGVPRAVWVMAPQTFALDNL